MQSTSTIFRRSKFRFIKGSIYSLKDLPTFRSLSLSLSLYDDDLDVAFELVWVVWNQSYNLLKIPTVIGVEDSFVDDLVSFFQLIVKKGFLFLLLRQCLVNSLILWKFVTSRYEKFFPWFLKETIFDVCLRTSSKSSKAFNWCSAISAAWTAWFSLSCFGSYNKLSFKYCLVDVILF